MVLTLKVNKQLLNIYDLEWIESRKEIMAEFPLAVGYVDGKAD